MDLSPWILDPTRESVFGFEFLVPLTYTTEVTLQSYRDKSSHQMGSSGALAGITISVPT